MRRGLAGSWLWGDQNLLNHMAFLAPQGPGAPSTQRRGQERKAFTEHQVETSDACPALQVQSSSPTRVTGSPTKGTAPPHLPAPKVQFHRHGLQEALPSASSQSLYLPIPLPTTSPKSRPYP